LKRGEAREAIVDQEEPWNSQVLARKPG